MASIQPVDDLGDHGEIVLVECDVCTLLVSFSDYASHVESHLAQFHMMALMEADIEADDRGDDYELNLLMQDLMGRVEVGVDNIDHVTQNVRLGQNDSIECPICLEVQDKIIKRTPCAHDFCSNCITTWLSSHKTCPICVADIQMLSTTSSMLSSSSMKATTSSSAFGSAVPDV